MNRINCVETLVGSLSGFTVVDLSHTLEEHIPCWPTHARFSHTVYESYHFGDVSCHHGVTMSEHTGTHMDAPLHFVAGGDGIDQVPLAHVMGRAAVIDATEIGPCGTVGSEFVQEWENKHGVLKTGDIVLLQFGWDRYWGVKPGDAMFLKDWPGIGEEAARYLAGKGVRAVGTDAMSIDAFGSDNPAHRIFLPNGIPIIENLTNLGKLPHFVFFIALPLKIKNGSGSPVRAVALLNPQM
ncbi:cyclase family protein [Paenibacillus hamazuiensis]|uniref:cyclase family protein n=1 Tax=Paenibacillus hamazuiensis TaxID=2936508 RepID=UPI00200E21AA